jgi:hypothetical protein
MFLPVRVIHSDDQIVILPADAAIP